MLDTKERYVLHKFPLVVDPVAACLEVQLALCKVLPNGDTERPGPRPTWAQLHRVKVQHDTFPFALDSRMVHFFGPEAKAEDCPFLLVYDAVGVLRYRVAREDGEFVPYEVPQELNGKPVIKPSVRVVFDAPEDAENYVRLVETIRAGGQIHPEGCEFLTNLLRRTSEVRFTSVAKKS